MSAQTAQARATVSVGLLPTLPCHAGMSMQVYAAEVFESLRTAPGVRATLLTPPFAATRNIGWLRSRWMRYVAYPMWAGAQAADVYHVTDHGNAPLLWRLPPARTVVTCHDLYPLAVAQGALRIPDGPTRARMLPTALRLTALRRARLVLTVSEHTRRECRELLGIPEDRLRVVHESVSPEFAEPGSPGEVAATRAGLGIDPDAIALLHVGSSDARKNLSAVCDVVARLRAGAARPVTLIKVGAPLSRRDAERAGRGAVLHLRGVSTAELARIYRASTALLYPSFHEGFCRPVVEAMTAGTPVVASTAGAIPEVAGGAAALCEPGDIDGLAARVAEIADSPRRGAEMAAAGRAASRRFSPDRQARALARAYREAAG